MIPLSRKTLKTTISTMLCALLIAGCASRDKTPGAIITTYKAVKAQIGKKKSSAIVNTSIRNITRAQVDAIPRPIVLRIEALKTKSLATAADLAENNGTLTILVAPSNTIHLKNHILTGTRGLGTDLISLETSHDTVRAALTAGTTKRIYRHLNSEGGLQPLRVTCKLTSRTPQALTLVDRTHSVTPVIEICKSDPHERTEQQFENTYLIDTKTGQVWQSTQWISAESGSFKIDVLKQQK